MTEQTEGAEALAHWILANVPDWLNPVDAREFARDILTSDWLRDREAAAEARGAQAALLKAADDAVPAFNMHPANRSNTVADWLRARAAAAAAGGGGEA